MAKHPSSPRTAKNSALQPADLATRIRWIITTWHTAQDAKLREEARQAIISLNDLTYFEPLRQELATNQTERERATLYWMLANLLEETGNAEVGQFLMDQVGCEAKATVKMELLRQIAKARGKARIKNAACALECLDAKKPGLRHAAVEALGSCGDPRAESALVERIGQQVRRPTESGWYLFDAARSLSEIGTKKALPVVLELLDRIDGLRLERKSDIESMAAKTLGRIGGKKQLDLFATILAGRSQTLTKWHAMRALHEHADTKQASVIATRVRAILDAAASADRPSAGHYGDQEDSELLLGLKTLVRLDRVNQEPHAGQFLRARFMPPEAPARSPTRRSP